MHTNEKNTSCRLSILGDPCQGTSRAEMNRTPIDLEALLNERKRAEDAASKVHDIERV